jgi:hypothetical protein
MTGGRRHKRDNSGHPRGRLRLRLTGHRSAVRCRRVDRHREPVVTIRNCLTVSSHCPCSRVTCRHARGVRQRQPVRQSHRVTCERARWLVPRGVGQDTLRRVRTLRTAHALRRHSKMLLRLPSPMGSLTNPRQCVNNQVGDVQNRHGVYPPHRRSLLGSM